MKQKTQIFLEGESPNLIYYLIQSFSISWEIYEFFKSNYWRCFMKKAVLENFAMLTRKLQACNFVKNRL